MHKRIIAIDSSTTVTGLTIAATQDGELLTLYTMPIKPGDLNPEELGYMKTKKKIRNNLKEYVAYVRPGELHLSHAEKERRDLEYRHANSLHKLKDLGSKIGRVFENVQPGLVLLEENMCFGGVLTTKLLAEAAGGVHFYCGMRDTPLKLINVNKVRAALKVPAMMQAYEKEHPGRLIKFKDPVKEIIKWHMLNKYADFNLRPNMTTDESDSLALFDYWVYHEWKPWTGASGHPLKSGV